jgi:hypothetical protein
VLTTHSMEEAETLCDRLGIFVDGRLVCIGNPKEITSRWGRGREEGSGGGWEASFRGERRGSLLWPRTSPPVRPIYFRSPALVDGGGRGIDTPEALCRVGPSSTAAPLSSGQA